MTAPLDLTSLRRALASLERGCARSRLAPEDEEVRDGVIQRFEFTYELCWRMLKRQLERDAPVPADIDRASFPELIRLGAEQGLIADAERWLVFRQQRNLTSHVYDEAKAWSVYGTAMAFGADARALLEALERRNRG